MPFLDGARALAAIVVVLSHFSNNGFLSFGEFTFSGIGKSGVYLFFFLSAFLLTRIIVLKGAAFWTGRSIGEYLVRRTLRIYPLFIIYLTLSLVTTLATTAILGHAVGVPLTIEPGQFAGHLALQDGKGVLWSIPVEFKYYFLLPFVAAGLVMAARRSVWLAVLPVVAACIAIEVWLTLNETRSGHIALRYYLQLFLTGSLFGVLDALYSERLMTAGRRLTGVATALFVVSVAAFVLTIPDLIEALLGREIDVRSAQRQYLVFTLIWGAFLFGLRYGAAPIRRAFSWTPLRYLGLISFSLYLWHEVAIWTFHQLDLGLDPLYAWVPILALAVAISHLSFVLVERPFLTMRPVALFAPLSAFRSRGREEHEPSH